MRLLVAREGYDDTTICSSRDARMQAYAGARSETQTDSNNRHVGQQDCRPHIDVAGKGARRGASMHGGSYGYYDWEIIRLLWTFLFVMVLERG